LLGRPKKLGGEHMSAGKLREGKVGKFHARWVGGEFKKKRGGRPVCEKTDAREAPNLDKESAIMGIRPHQKFPAFARNDSG